jgi:hypothetical protein
MAKNHTLSAPKIGEMMGVSRVTALSWLKAGKIPPAKLANPGGKQGRYDNTPELRAWCKKFKKMEAERKARPRATRAQRMSQRRLEKIDKLEGILKNRTPVSADEKEAALWYLRCLRVLNQASWGRDLSGQFPLLEGVHAVFEKLLTRGCVFDLKFCDALDLEQKIEDWPTTPPRNGQSSLNASD